MPGCAADKMLDLGVCDSGIAFFTRWAELRRTPRQAVFCAVRIASLTEAGSMLGSSRAGSPPTDLAIGADSGQPRPPTTWWLMPPAFALS